MRYLLYAGELLSKIETAFCELFDDCGYDPEELNSENEENGEEDEEGEEEGEEEAAGEEANEEGEGEDEGGADGEGDNEQGEENEGNEEEGEGGEEGVMDAVLVEKIKASIGYGTLYVQKSKKVITFPPTLQSSNFKFSGSKSYWRKCSCGLGIRAWARY